MTMRPALWAALVALALAAGCTPAPKMIGSGPDVSSNVSTGAVGKIQIKSWNASTAALMAGTLPNPDVPVDAVLTLPKNPSGKVPAAIILHGISGIGAHYSQVAEMLNGMGMAALVIDSYATRDVKAVSEATRKSPYSYRVADAYAGLKLLSTHPAIDPNRIALIGYSAGGAVMLLSVSGQARRATVGDGGPRFAAYVGYYPHCAVQYRSPEAPGVPMLMLLGGADNITPPQICQTYGDRLKAKGADLKVVVYPGAHHAFDLASFAGKITPYPVLPNLSKCEDRVLQIQEDGGWFATWLNRSAQTAVEFGDPYAGCKSGEGSLGGPVEARTKSLAELRDFLKRAVGAK